MKNTDSKDHHLINDSLVGGASLSLGDLVMIQSREIKWLKISQSDNLLDIGSIAE